MLTHLHRRLAGQGLRALAVVGVTAWLVAGACSRPGTQGISADSTAAFDERVLFRTTAAERLLAIRARLDSLERELPGAVFDAGLRGRAAALEAQRDSLSRRVRDATEDEWLAMRLRAADVLDSLEQRLDRLSGDLRRHS